MTVALQSDVHACIADDRVVLLDLPRDRYHAVGGKAEAVVRWLITGQSLGEIDRQALSPLLAANLIRYTEDPPSLPPPAARCHAMSGLFDDPRKSWNPFTPMLAAVYHRAAERAVTRHGLKVVLDRLKRDKDHAATRDFRPDRERLLALAAAFSGYARLVKTHDRCLHRSIALARFLNHHGQFPDVVLAVKTRPFSAHAWVQFEDTVLNDELDHVLPFTPILVI